MKRSLIGLVALALFAVLPGCGTDEALDDDTGAAEFESTFASGFPKMYVRGTMNGWGKTAMKLVADNLWSAEVTTGEGEQGFKFDVYGNWKKNFGDDDGDQIWNPGGANIALEANQILRITLNDASGFYWVERRTWSAEVVLAPPSGVEPLSLNGAQAKLVADGQDYGWVNVYFDAERGVAYAPVSGLSRGSSYALEFDAMVAGQRLTGEVAWRVTDGSADPIALQLALSVASLEEMGAVELTVLADRWQDGNLVSGPYAGMGVYLGDWHAGHSLGVTDSQGMLTVRVDAGEQLFGLMTMTSSHSMTSSSVTVNVEAGKLVRAEAHVVANSVSIRVHHDAGMGNAIYLTGASDYLGNWTRAVRLNYVEGLGYWSFYGNLPVGLPFKIVRGPWVDEPTIDISRVQWELGDNRTVAAPSGYVSTEMDLWPAF